MAVTKEIAQRDMLKAHPDYKAGYEAALRGEPMGIVSAAFDAGWEAATETKRILGNAGFEEKAPGQFSKTITRKLRENGNARLAPSTNIQPEERHVIRP